MLNAVSAEPDKAFAGAVAVADKQARMLQRKVRNLDGIPLGNAAIQPRCCSVEVERAKPDCITSRDRDAIDGAPDDAVGNVAASVGARRACSRG